ncbi:serine/threonine-protein kinase rio2 [Nasonia vitripennis]|uniref:Serine/threonine-protein kinase RIO2 n=1 Tax=Nasonia vitripennis TaxID=7425 RepID=A0A7M7G2A9_NASVI|nr:serine/threonine-protein kinase rio2 [Nasonia vitripennis]
MGKLDVKMMRYLTKEDFRVLTAIEMGMKNHELVSMTLAAQIANLHHGGLHKILKELCKHRLLMYEATKQYQGYRLTNLGYDYLALKTLTARGLIDSFGNQIGVGKESNIYVVQKKDEEIPYCLKLHRLGRTCFRKVKNKRDYHQHRKHMSWLYLSRVSATKEFAYMTALYDRGFPVPKPIDFNRHCIIMELVDGIPLCNVREVENKERLYNDLMNLICRLALHGVIHGDFNEFNIMITHDEKPILIDFPQMISTEHEEAEVYFERDVFCIREFFRRRFDYESSMYPIFKNIVNNDAEDAKKHPKVELHSPTVSDAEDYDVDDEEDDEEDPEEAREKLAQLEIEVKPNLNSTINAYLNTCDYSHEQEESADTETVLPENQDSESNKQEVEKKVLFPEPVVATNEDNVESSETNQESEVHDEVPELVKVSAEQQNDTDSNYDVRSTASTIIPEDQIKRRMKMELVRREKKAVNKRNLKKSTKATRSRRENLDIAKENVDFWG